MSTSFRNRAWYLWLGWLAWAGTGTGAEVFPGDAGLAAYFEEETARLAGRCLDGIRDRADWESRRMQYRKELFEMMGLDPLPERSELKVMLTGRAERGEVVVERLHYQSMPGLYVTANLYLPRTRAGRIPAVLYLSGHGRVAKEGVSYGNKVHYQHHGMWFAQHGFACLILDTVQLGEIEGVHHGTYREGMWWWNARGYTPAGVEAWNAIRALDLLESRPEVDAARMGATGRSGGGAYSWWVGALDDRIRVAAPVAGITDLENHVVDGRVEGHCDCMYFVNTYRWDFAQLAALMAPRPLLLVNTDSDSIFPLDGVIRVHEKVRRIYRLMEAGDRLGLVIGPGPHKDTQDLQVPVFRWFTHYLKGEDPLIAEPATPGFEPEQLKVLAQLPADERSSRIHDSFVPSAAPPRVPVSAGEWEVMRQGWMTSLRTKSFGGWPESEAPIAVQRLGKVEAEGLVMEAFEYSSQEQVRLRGYLVRDPTTQRPRRVTVSVLEDESLPAGLGLRSQAGDPERARFAGPARAEAVPQGPLLSYYAWLAAMSAGFKDGLSDERRAAGLTESDTGSWTTWKQARGRDGQVDVFLVPRGIGLTGWAPEKKRQIQIRRRFMLIGQTLEGMRVWDLRRGLRAARSLLEASAGGWELRAHGEMGCNALYAALFEPGVERLDLWALPATHMEGPDYLNVLKYLDIPQAVAMAGERMEVRIHQVRGGVGEYATQVGSALSWRKNGVRLLSELGDGKERTQ